MKIDHSLIIRQLLFSAAAVLTALTTGVAGAQTLTDGALVSALQRGGYVIVMRHASSPRSRPRAADAASGNTDRERQLDQQGIRSARAMGAAFRSLHIPVAAVLSSPTFRAMQTARLLDLAAPQAVDELGEGAQGMHGPAEAERTVWLRTRVAQTPPAGTNTLIVTHTPNLRGAFPQAAADISAGESLILRPSAGSASVVARVKIDQWPALAASD